MPAHPILIRRRATAFDAIISRRGTIIGPDGAKIAVSFGKPYSAKVITLSRVRTTVDGVDYSGIFYAYSQPVHLKPVKRRPTTFS